MVRQVLGSLNVNVIHDHGLLVLVAVPPFVSKFHVGVWILIGGLLSLT